MKCRSTKAGDFTIGAVVELFFNFSKFSLRVLLTLPNLGVNMSEEKAKYSEGAPWFWKIFGGGIVSLISILLLSYFTALNTNIDRNFIDIRLDLKELHQNTNNCKDRLTTLEQNNNKDKIAEMDKNISLLKANLAASESALEALKEEYKSMKECNKDLSKQVNEMREKLATLTAQKPVEKKN